MDTPVLNKPRVNITPKITKINNLVDSADQIRKTSTKLRKVFEKGTYQKKTQLTVLNRYKRRLESIQKQNDKRFLRKQKVKIKLPEVKKFAGSFFTPGSTSDPLKAIGALAAFNAFRKGSKGDLGGAIGPALVAAGIFFGPALLKGGSALLKGGGGKPSNPPQVGAAGATAGSFWGTPYGETAAGKSYASMRQFRNLPKWAQRLSSSSAGRFAASNERIIQGTANIGDRLRVGTRGMGMQGVGGIAENVATSKLSISPRVGLLNAALFGLDFMGRKAGGQTNLQAAAGAGAGVGGALIGAAIGSLLFPGVGTLAGFLIGAAFSTGGALIASKIADTLTGADRLKQQTEEQKKLVEKKGGGVLTFGKTLNSYEKVVNKFEEFAKNFKGFMGMSGEQSGLIETGNRGMNTGLELQDVEATGGEVPGTPDSPYGPRWGKTHYGNDYFKNVGTPISVIQPGTVTVADMNYNPSGWGAVVEIRHDDGSLSRYAHLSKIHVAAGTKVTPGQVVGLTGGASGAPGSGNSKGPHLHFEYENSSGQRVDPTAVAPKIFRFGGNVRVKQQPTPTQRPPQPSRSGVPENSYSVSEQILESSVVEPPQITPTASRAPSISYYDSTSGRSQNQIIPVPIPISRQPQVMSQESSEMMLIGQSELQTLNSYYKRILLTTLE